MKRQWYYRGSLKSCNYSCSYCPFSKQKGSVKEYQEDKKALFSFVDAMEKEGREGAVQIVPYGEALIHEYYWEALARLSKNPALEAVGAQSNFSFPVEKMITHFLEHAGDIRKLRLWGTFHPEMTSAQSFVSQCQKLLDKKVSFCVGAVGVPKQLSLIKQLRQTLPEQVYLWINKMDGLKRSYTSEEKAAFLEIDEYFEMELKHHPANPSLCVESRFVEADGTLHGCNISRQCLGNIYEREEIEEYCSRKECSCYLSYCNQPLEQLLFFQPYPAFRIPTYPKAVFFDVDGTLIPDGEEKIPEEIVRGVHRLSGHSDIYLATSLPREEAVRTTREIWNDLSGGVFANGGMCTINSTGRGGEDSWTEIEPFPDEWIERARYIGKREGFHVFVYRKKEETYKVTLVFRKGVLPERITEEFIPEWRMKLLIPACCEVLIEGECFQVTKKGTGKLEGILKICEKMGYGKEEVAVMGNAENDIPMLQFFPFSVVAKGSPKELRANAGFYFDEMGNLLKNQFQPIKNREPNGMSCADKDFCV